MLKEYGHVHSRKFASAMAHYVYDKTIDMQIDFDDQCMNDQAGESIELFGRRILHCDPYGNVELLKFDTVAKASAEFDAMRFPSTGDSVIYENFDVRGAGRYTVFLNDGFTLGAENTAATLHDALHLLAQMMVDAGEFPPAWLVNGYGTYEAIDGKLRPFHDEGGTQMAEVTA